ANLAERALEPQGQALPEWKRLNYDSEAAYWRAKFNEAQTTIKAHQAVLESVKEERDALASQLALPAGPVPLTKDQQEAIEGGIRALRMHSDGFISKMFRKELQTMLDAAAQTDA
ncbi:hypothetical protein NYZ34_19880, partial [Acinetobacter baumannii]|nr:hypothetical protein [Acinetobacter baumannii]